MRTIMKLSFILIIFILVWQGVLKYGGKGKMEPIPDLAKYGSYYDEIWDVLIAEADIGDIWPADSTISYVDSTLSGWKHLTVPVQGYSWDTVRVNNILYQRTLEDVSGIYSASLYIVNNWGEEDVYVVFSAYTRSSGSPRVRFRLCTGQHYENEGSTKKKLECGTLTSYYLYHYEAPGDVDYQRLHIDVGNKAMHYAEYEVDEYVTKWTKTWTDENDRPHYPYRGGSLK